MKLQKVFYVLVLGLLMMTLTGATGMMAQNSDQETSGKSSQSCCPGGAKSAAECTSEERASCQIKKCGEHAAKCESQTKKCNPSACSASCDHKKDDSGN